MALEVVDVRVKGYRSLKSIAYPMSPLDVFVGANGVGKTNLYRALALLQSAATNRLGWNLADEGMAAALWAGPRPSGKPVQMTLSVRLAAAGGRGVYDYQVMAGLPPPPCWNNSGSFDLEPQIKEETLAFVAGGRTTTLLKRSGRHVVGRGEDGRKEQIEIDLLASETLLGRLEDSVRHPELDLVRRTLLQWRFFHDFRTDAGSPLRRPCVALAVPTLASDGANLAAVLATLVHIRQDSVDLDDAIDEAFPGARLVAPKPDRTASFGMTFPEFPQRVFEAGELSDGTLRFLALAGALLSYRLPPFIALNEPESSLHPELMAPLAKMVVKASERAQVWLVTHSTALAETIAATGAGRVRTVVKRDGATAIEGLKAWGAFAETEDEME